ncbi:hypothetical protein DB345_11795 [Spartobacteria bacterium LR76]|nr:hypothetical protein DB345_11795 [Spartobacteria bacterium LR76]
MKRFIFSTVLAAALSGNTFPSAGEIPPPRTPYVASVPQYADWTMRLVPSTDATKEKEPALSPGTPVLVQTTRTLGIRHRVTTYASGYRLESWQSGVAALNDLDESDVTVADMSQVEAFDMSIQNVFTETAWVNISNFQGIAQIDKVNYYHYVNGSEEAWINIETMLPSFYKKGELMYRFQFNPAPTAMLVLPPKYQAGLDKFNRMMDRRARLAKEIK